MRFLALAFIFHLLISCSGLLPWKVDYVETRSLGRDQVLVEHLAMVLQRFYPYAHSKFIKLNQNDQLYLKNLLNQILISNHFENLKNKNIELEIINNNEPFLYSDGSLKIIVSNGYLLNFADSEQLFVVGLCREMTRLNYQLFNRVSFIPHKEYGHADLKKIFGLSLKQRIELNKWTYRCVQNAGFDPSVVMTWLQKQSRLSGFNFMKPDERILSVEEAEFKSFIIKFPKRSIGIKNSSKQFYQFYVKVRNINV